MKTATTNFKGLAELLTKTAELIIWLDKNKIAYKAKDEVWYATGPVIELRNQLAISINADGTYNLENPADPCIASKITLKELIKIIK